MPDCRRGVRRPHLRSTTPPTGAGRRRPARRRSPTASSSAFDRLADDAALAPTHRRQGAAGRHGGRRVPPLHPAARPAGRARRRPRGRRWRRSCAAFDGFHERPRRPTGWRAWSRRTSATASPPTSTARSPRSSTRRPGAGARRARRHRPRRVRGREVREAIAADPRVAGRLALWGRRLVGEVLSQAQRVAAERDALSNLLVGGIGGGSRRAAGLRPRRGRPDVRPAHREAHAPDAGPRAVGLTGAAARRPARQPGSAQMAPKPTRRWSASPIST